VKAGTLRQIQLRARIEQSSVARHHEYLYRWREDPAMYRWTLKRRQAALVRHIQHRATW